MKITVKQQATTFLNTAGTRKRDPVKATTLRGYRSYVRNWIGPRLGDLDLAKLDNAGLKAFVTVLAENHLKPATINIILSVIKQIAKSAVDENGNYLYPKTWNNDFIDAPIVDPKSQKAPMIARQAVSEAISQAPGQYRALYAILAGTGLRIGEATALRVGVQDGVTYYDAARRLVVVKTQIGENGKEGSPKTAAGVREIDIEPSLNTFLVQEIAALERKPGEFMFQNEFGTGPMRRHFTCNINKEVGVPGHHSLRRFRMTHMENQNVPRGLVDFWMGHTGKDVHDRYVKIGQEVEARRQWADKAGLGFELPEGK